MSVFDQERREFEELTRKALSRENAPGWYYVSFADPNGWLGAVIIQAFGVVSATILAHHAGINPGGEAQAIPCVRKPPNDFVYRLLDKADVIAIDESFGISHN